MSILRPISDHPIVNVLTVTKGLLIFVSNAIIVIHVITKSRVLKKKEKIARPE
jgi:hypothetical protein